MTRIRKSERDFAAADLAAVNGLIGQLTDDDVMMRFSLEARRDELAELLRQAEVETPPEHKATAELFFGGRPVVGSRGIESEFAGNAVTRFQDLVAKLFAVQDTGMLAQRGMVPNKSAARLHITNIVRGSFGFLLEEMEPQGEIVDTALKAAVEEASQLLGAFGGPDEERFQAAVESIDSRVLKTAREFFDLLRQDAATFRIVVGEVDKSFGLDAVARAAERASMTDVSEAEEILIGQLSGTLPDAHMFEFHAEGDRGLVRGKVDRSIPTSELSRYNRDLVERPARATIQIKRLLQRGRVTRENFVLTRIELIEK